MILNHTTTTPFRVNELVPFHELNSCLLAYMLIPFPQFSSEQNYKIKHSTSNKINTRFSEYTDGYNFFFTFKLKLLLFFSFICDASIEIICDENLQCKSIQLTQNSPSRFLVFRLDTSWDAFEPMNAKTIVRDIDRHSHILPHIKSQIMITSTSVWKLQSVSLSLSLSTVNFLLFFVWGKPENISRVDFLSKHPIIQLYQATSLGFLLVFSVKQIFRIALQCMRCLSR